MSIKINPKADNLLVLISIIYVTLPIGIFYIGWLKVPLACLSIASIVYFTYIIYKNMTNKELPLFHYINWKYWAITAIIGGG